MGKWKHTTARWLAVVMTVALTIGLIPMTGGAASKVNTEVKGAKSGVISYKGEAAEAEKYQLTLPGEFEGYLTLSEGCDSNYDEQQERNVYYVPSDFTIRLDVESEWDVSDMQVALTGANDGAAITASAEDPYLFEITGLTQAAAIEITGVYTESRFMWFTGGEVLTEAGVEGKIVDEEGTVVSSEEMFDEDTILSPGQKYYLEFTGNVSTLRVFYQGYADELEPLEQGTNFVRYDISKVKYDTMEGLQLVYGNKYRIFVDSGDLGASLVLFQPDEEEQEDIQCELRPGGQLQFWLADSAGFDCSHMEMTITDGAGNAVNYTKSTERQRVDPDGKMEYVYTVADLSDDIMIRLTGMTRKNFSVSISKPGENVTVSTLYIGDEAGMAEEDLEELEGTVDAAGNTVYEEIPYGKSGMFYVTMPVGDNLPAVSCQSSTEGNEYNTELRGKKYNAMCTDTEVCYRYWFEIDGAITINIDASGHKVSVAASDGGKMAYDGTSIYDGEDEENVFLDVSGLPTIVSDNREYSFIVSEGRGYKVTDWDELLQAKDPVTGALTTLSATYVEDEGYRYDLPQGAYELIVNKEVLEEKTVTYTIRTNPEENLQLDFSATSPEIVVTEKDGVYTLTIPSRLFNFSFRVIDKGDTSVENLKIFAPNESLEDEFDYWIEPEENNEAICWVYVFPEVLDMVVAYSMGSVVVPTQKPTVAPTKTPDETPNVTPNVMPNVAPTKDPSGAQTKDPSSTPTQKPTDKPTQKPVVKVSKIQIDGMSKKIAAGKSVKLTAKITPDNANTKKVTWSTSNKKFATVNANGVVRTKKAGAGKKVTITAAATDGSGVKATYRITIMKNAVKKIALKAKSKTVKAGKKLTIKASVKPSKSVNKTLSWKSSNTKFATVSQKGVVKTKKAGAGKKVTITATATDGSGKKAKFVIKIKK